jgi:hypothetical protein
MNPIQPDDLSFLARATTEFMREFPAKFQEGAERNYSRGPLVECPNLLTQMDQEVLDQWSYTRAIRYRMERITSELAKLARNNPKISDDINDIIALLPR